jgi:hypothetical protein
MAQLKGKWLEDAAVTEDKLGTGAVTVDKIGADAVNADKIDETDDYTWTGAHDFTGGSVVVPSPSADDDAAPKSYVDNAVLGLKWKEPVAVRAQGDVDISSAPATIDGESLSTDERVLLDQQSTGTEDGIYLYKGAGNPMARTDDAAVGAVFANASMFVERGTDADTFYTCTNDSGSDVIGTDALTMVQFGGALEVHALGGSSHSADTLANLNSKIAGGKTLVAKEDANSWSGKQTFADLLMTPKAADPGTPGAGEAYITSGAHALGAGLLRVYDGGSFKVPITRGDGLFVALGAAPGQINDWAPSGYQEKEHIFANFSGGNLTLTGIVPEGRVNKLVLQCFASDTSLLIVKDQSASSLALNRFYLGTSEDLTMRTGDYAVFIRSSAIGNMWLYVGGGTSYAADDYVWARSSDSGASSKYPHQLRVAASQIMAKLASGGLKGCSTAEIRTLLQVTPFQEMHKVTAGEVTAGYFTLAHPPLSAGHVVATVVGGVQQVNKQVVGATGVTPDFDVLSNNQLHIANVIASGLSEGIVADDVLMVSYQY